MEPIVLSVVKNEEGFTLQFPKAFAFEDDKVVVTQVGKGLLLSPYNPTNQASEPQTLYLPNHIMNSIYPPHPKSSANSGAQKRKAGFAKGTFAWVSDDFDNPLDDFKGYMP